VSGAGVWVTEMRHDHFCGHVHRFPKVREFEEAVRVVMLGLDHVAFAEAVDYGAGSAAGDTRYQT
jgi:hypothetical protein